MTVPEFVLYQFESHSYPIEVWFVVNADGWKQIVEMIGLSLESDPYPDSDARCSMFRPENGPNRIIITISDAAEKRTSTEVVGLMAHEVMHVIRHINDGIFYSNAGSGMDRIDYETEAYLMQKMLMWLLTVYAEAGRGFTDASMPDRNQGAMA